ncbi:MAG: class I SAM-dependent methyltransferase, partial [Kangiellaceae bacterium]
GRHTHFFSQLGFNAHGMEVSHEKVKTLNEKFSTNTFFKSVTDNIDADSESYDFVVGANSIYYLDDEYSSIDNNLVELSRVLKGGGCLVVSFIGERHFLLDGCRKLDDKSVIVKRDPLGFRNETKIRPAWGKEDIKDMFESHIELELSKIGEVTDECDDKIRHLYYCVIYKS